MNRLASRIVRCNKPWMLRSLGIFLLGWSLAAPVVAHDGGFGHSRRTMYVAASAEGFTIEYRLKQGLEEAIVELVHADANQDGQISDSERDAFFTARGEQLLKNLTCRDAQSGKALPLEFVRFDLAHSLVQVYQFRTTSSAKSILLEDRNFPHKPGQVSILTAEGLTAELPEKIDLTHADHVRVVIGSAEKR